MFKVPISPLLAVPVCLNMVHIFWGLVMSPKTVSGKISECRAFHSLGLLEFMSWYKHDMPLPVARKVSYNWLSYQSSIQLRSNKGAETEEFSIYSSSTASWGTATSADVFSRLAQDILFVIETHKIFCLPYGKGVNSSILTLWLEVQKNKIFCKCSDLRKEWSF